MKVSKRLRARSATDGAVGLLAFGSSGAWEIAIDQTLSGSDRWYAQIEGPLVYCYFEIPSVDLLEEVIGFLENRNTMVRAAPKDILALGSGRSRQVTLVRDDEFHDRFFVDFKSKTGPFVRFTLTNDDLAQILDALRQVQEDLE